MRAVIIDDSPVIRSILSTLAGEITGVAAAAFASPLHALAHLEAEDADIVIVDYEMPDIDGIAFIARLRRIVRHAAVPVIMVTISADREVRNRALQAGATDFLSKPVDPTELRARMSNLLALRAAHRRLADRATWLAEEVAKATAALRSHEQEVIWRLSMAAEHRDRETANHVLRVAAYAGLIARRLGLDDAIAQEVERAAPMHDIGKVGISDAVLLKPGRLEPEEFEAMKAHTRIGGRILGRSSSPLIRLAAEIALSHHEKFDGSGYPDGLSGREIPLPGRIVAVADVFDALTSSRVYKPAWPFERALDLIREQAGRHFDPDCATAFVDAEHAVRKIRERLADPDAAAVRAETSHEGW